MSKTFKVAIDGPAGSGKSTIAKEIAKIFNLYYLDSGALYRAFGYFVKKMNFDLFNEDDIIKALKDFDIKIIDGEYYLGDEKLGMQIRTPEIGKAASIVAKNEKVRNKVNEILKSLSKIHNVVIDGRDIGTVVLPDADVKIFLTASIEERARRRYKELLEKGKNVNYEEIYKEIEKRDIADSTRDIAPLKPAEDAITVDTTGKDIKTVVDEISKIINKKINQE
ncbi:cytidylate kinase [Marinitoga sp. 1135]|uniref:Cytidylate kinase n=1 Tax=Marinitoga piezophila (strain DSM 14283 / JCM 11233 / KA3) TaxID=443254 RepID=H2J644_MARPK|nr:MULTISPECIES: (d)CMP kinase [Marinitoga]AEX85105.1 cytidylate kinase [Marinitoga piezophila KA3]APT75609.1 cytidylate kinase [Marinitoga sp. 1137]NUU95318.1 cytidylate kinase [Marinitoga sp. 1135]NUU97252.1 cytidylate kinase [Marinitoga sp. 1138]